MLPFPFCSVSLEYTKLAYLNYFSSPSYIVKKNKKTKGRLLD